MKIENWIPFSKFNFQFWYRLDSKLNERAHNSCVGDGGQCQAYVGLQATWQSSTHLRRLWCPAPGIIWLLYSCVNAPCSNNAPPRVWGDTGSALRTFRTVMHTPIYIILPVVLCVHGIRDGPIIPKNLPIILLRIFPEPNQLFLKTKPILDNNFTLNIAEKCFCWLICM